LVGPELPYVVAHVAISIDGATTGFDPDVERFYALARTWREDVTLAGADTVLAQRDALAAAPMPGPATDGPLLAVVDSRRRVRDWRALRDCGHWSDVIALRGSPAPASAPAVPALELIVGNDRNGSADRVDLAAALATLARLEGARVVRVDSGGSLLGALLERGLVDELSLLVHPCVAGTAADRPWHGSAALPAAQLERLAHRSLDGGLVWLRYRIAPSDRARSLLPSGQRVALCGAERALKAWRMPAPASLGRRSLRSPRS
jgi:2,5-diamino-6-(ribosylamino)-4(3H)-pyrimidinone 5'-phosphate reductase